MTNTKILPNEEEESAMTKKSPSQQPPPVGYEIAERDEVQGIQPMSIEGKAIDNPTKPNNDSHYEQLLILCGLGLMAYLGAYIRVGIMYYRIWKVEVNYCLMYTQVVGCMLMGFMLPMKTKMTKDPNTSTRLSRVIYFSITTGLCGSITSFSTWSMQANKNFLLQWDGTWGNVASSFNGGRLFEYFISMWIGVVLPLSALQLGRYIHEHYAKGVIDKYGNVELSACSKVFVEVCIVLGFIVATILVIVIPIAVEPSWSYLCYTAVLGFAGAYLRYLLSFCNPIYPEFPIGTFVVNVTGTWLLAAFTTISHYLVDYYDADLQAVMFGLSTGFCGCLTTVSTFVAEIDHLQTAVSGSAAYKYAIVSNVFAQIGIIFIYNIYAFQTVPTSSLAQPSSISQCATNQILCEELLHRIACPIAARNNVACTNGNDDSSFIGNCSCGSFVGDRVTELICDAQVKGNGTNNLVPIWPKYAKQMNDPSQTIDYCLTFQNMCDHYLERVNCPSHLRQITACTYGDGVLSTVSECTCGGNDVPGGRIQELITDVSLFRRYDLVDVAGYITLDAVNLCSTFTSTCDKMLEHINCPADEKVSIGCDDVLDYDTWQGVCTCGDYDTSDRVTEDIYDSLMRSNFQTLVVEFNQTNHNNIDRNTSYEFSSPDKQWDMCASYKAICNSFLDKIACPTALQQISTCGNISTAYPYGQIQYYNGSCVCGGMDTLNDRNFEVVIDALLFESINKHYLYLPPPQATYSLMAGHNPFKQLLYQENKNHVVPQ